MFITSTEDKEKATALNSTASIEQPPGNSPQQVPFIQTYHDRKRLKPAKIILIVIAGIIVIVSGFTSISYYALQNSIKAHDFAAAEKYLKYTMLLRSELKNEAAYIDAGRLMENNAYEDAEKAFSALGTFIDSKEMAKEVRYLEAASEIDKDNFDGAAAIYQSLGDYKDAAARVQETFKEKGLYYLDKKDFENAVKVFRSLKKDGYESADELLKMTYYKHAADLMATGDKFDAYQKLLSAGDYEDSPELRDKLSTELYDKAVTYYRSEAIESAQKIFSILNGFRRSNDYITLCKAHSTAYATSYGNVTESEIDLVVWELMALIGFENAESIILNTPDFMHAFFKGTWSGDNHKLVFEDGGLTTDLPFPSYATSYAVQDNLWQAFGDNDTEGETIWFVTIYTTDQISVYVYSDNVSYMMYRQQ